MIGLGEFLDKVFIGELVRFIFFNYFIVIISDGIFLVVLFLIKVKIKIWNNEYIDFRIIINFREEFLSVFIFFGVINFY